MLSQFTDQTAQKRVLKELHDFPRDAYPVGRLDENSEGLLLLSNDRKFIKKMQEKPAEKEYWVQVEGMPLPKDLEILSRGVTIKVKKKAYRTKPAKAWILEQEPALPPRHPPVRYRKYIPTTWIAVILLEGKNRQIRKMTAAIGFPTLRLVRARIGKLWIGTMQPGQVKTVTPDML